MFPNNYFPKGYFTGQYFPPVVGVIITQPKGAAPGRKNFYAAESYEELDSLIDRLHKEDEEILAILIVAAQAGVFDDG